MNLSVHLLGNQALPRIIASFLLALSAWYSGCAAADMRTSWPGPDDAAAIVAADRDLFLAVAQDAPVLAEDSGEDIAHVSAREDADPGLTDLAMYSVLIEADPDVRESVELYVSRATLFLERGFHDRAIDDLLAALRLDTDAQAAWQLLGRAHEMKGELVMAQAAYAEAVQLGADTESGVAASWDSEVLTLVSDDDRLEVLTALGMPDAFTLLMIAPAPDVGRVERHETWLYYRAGARFEFIDGRLVDSADMADIDPDNVDALFVPYRPYQFLFDRDFDAIADIIGEHEYALYDVDEGSPQGLQLVYTRQLALGFRDGGLFYVRAFPLFTDE